MDIRITQLDGKLPNLALMGLSQYHRDRGDVVHFSRSPYRGLFEPKYGRVYGSAIFSFSARRVSRLLESFPNATVGGTWNTSNSVTVEDVIGTYPSKYDYSIYPDFQGSIGFTARGCRLKCKFCVVPGKEGPPRTVATIADIWRGPDYPKHLHLLDNDFFGQPKQAWQARLSEIRDGGFKVCFNQGINIRMIDEESAEAIASVPYYDDGFTVRRLYTAWDNIGDERRFFDGVNTLGRAGIPPRNIMAYMLIGYDHRETWERLFYRFNKMVELGIRPYPMVFQNKTIPLGGCKLRIGHRTLKEFQRWVIRRVYTFSSFEDYNVNPRSRIKSGQRTLYSRVKA